MILFLFGLKLHLRNIGVVISPTNFLLFLGWRSAGPWLWWPFIRWWCAQLRKWIIFLSRRQSQFVHIMCFRLQRWIVSKFCVFFNTFRAAQTLRGIQNARKTFVWLAVLCIHIVCSAGPSIICYSFKTTFIWLYLFSFHLFGRECARARVFVCREKHCLHPWKAK